MASPSNVSGPGFLAPTIGVAVRIWWAWFWRWALIYLAGVLFLLDIPVKGLALALGGTHGATAVVAVAVTITWMVAAQLYALWSLFPKQFRGFELQVEEIRNPPAQRPIFVDPPWKQVLRIWWAWFWRQMAWTLSLGLVVAVALGVALHLSGADQKTTEIAGNVTGIVINAAAAVLLLPGILRKDFGMYRIRLLPAGGR